MTDAELAAIKERRTAAAKGPVEVYDPAKHPYQNGGLVTDGKELWGGYDGEMAPAADLAFMAHAYQDVPALLAEVERLRAAQTAAVNDALEWAVATVDEYADEIGEGWGSDGMKDAIRALKSPADTPPSK